MRKYYPLRECVLFASLWLVLDQTSKLWMLARAQTSPIALMPGLNLHLTINHGAAFGIFSQADGWQIWLFSAVAVLITVVILFWSKRLTVLDRFENLALACILGGALGNLLDRVRLGGVVDFIDFYINNYHWYTFNIADTAICLGAAMLIIKIVLLTHAKPAV